MLNKKAIIFTLLFGVLFNAKAQFSLNVNKTTGALTKISNPTDKYAMNWVFASGDQYLTWQKPEQDWGLGKYDISNLNVKNEKWTSPSEIKETAGKSTLLYKTKCLDIKVERIPSGNDLIETYTFTNTTGKKLSVSGLDIYTPFNDNYPDAKTAATNRCNAHVWAGLNSSYVNAVRMDSEAPHLGLVFTQGALKSYSIDNRGTFKDIPFAYSSSNVRGLIVLNIASFDLDAKGSYTVQWKLFWHNGWEDFFKKAIASGFVKLEADSYTIEQGQQLKIAIDAKKELGIKNKSISVIGNQLGEQTQKIVYANGKKQTMLNYYVVSNEQKLIDKRVHFIVDHQQMNNSNDPRYGAYMLYDNEADTIVTNVQNLTAKSDKDTGRERVGMGVLIAKWLQTHNDEKVRSSLLRYVKFVREKLQDPDYKVYSTVDHKSKHRGYNYPWIAHLYLETYKLTNEKQYLIDFSGTMSKYFQEFGYKHYSIGFRVGDGLTALENAGMKTERDNLFNAYKQVGDFFAENGIFYPKHEVNYEQSIVAPAVSFLCDMYLLTKDKKYLDGAKLQLQSLEAFNGKQPDVHLNDIAIRHWDGYWFGKKATWGDTMPHYWSTLTAAAFQKYYECTDDINYRERAKRIVKNNLLNFKEDGKASCAYLYPAFINNQPGKFYDSFANDQDWALVYYNEVIEKNK